MGGGQKPDYHKDRHNFQRAVELLKDLMKPHHSKNVITLAGAGISTSAGISDFKSQGGSNNKGKHLVRRNREAPWDKYTLEDRPELLFSTLRDTFFQDLLKPTDTHCFIKLLETKGILLRHFTQNIDGMELMTELKPEKVVEAHGSLHRSYCTGCKKKYDFEWLSKKIRTGPVPLCDSCGAIVRPDIILFGENLHQSFEFRTFVDLPRCDLLLILGTTLQVDPFASIVESIPPNTPVIMISKESLSEMNMNFEEDDLHIFLKAQCDSAVVSIVKRLGWAYDFEQIKRKVKLNVLYGRSVNVDIGVQTVPIQTPDDQKKVKMESSRWRCSQFRCGEK